MSIHLKQIRDRIRVRARNMDPRKPTLATPEIDQAICDVAIELGSFLPAPQVYSASAITIAAGASTSNLPTTVTQWTGNDGGAEYNGDIRLQLVNTGVFLIQVSRDEMDALSNGAVIYPVSRPTHFALWEEKDQTVQLKFWPGAKAAEPLNLFCSLQYDDLRDFIGTGLDDLDDVEIQFSRVAAQALVLMTLSEFLNRPDLYQRGMAMAMREASRRHNVESHGRTERWVP